MRGMCAIRHRKRWDKETEARVRTDGAGLRRRLLRLPMIVQDEHPSWDAQSSEDGIRDTRGRLAQGIILVTYFMDITRTEG